ncbi:hypothetical protein CVS40_6010 [Lucilia cuprina]|nr:hypothetical protein CVS40_6010 [Lucilia cuprina]
MRLVKQHKNISIRNIDSSMHTDSKIRHSSLLPNSIRALVVGPSNCGKTNVMIGLIESPNGLKFENIYLYSKSLYQPKYEYLKSLISPIRGMGYYTFSDNESVISPDKAKINSIMIFDDVACEKQNNIRAYFCMGRHKNVDSFYLCQTYTRIPKHLIRDNANMIVMFKQDEMNMKHIYSDHVGSDMTFEKFNEICQECWKEKFGFLVISKDDELNNGRYRKMFDYFITT